MARSCMIVVLFAAILLISSAENSFAREERSEDEKTEPDLSKANGPEPDFKEEPSDDNSQASNSKNPKKREKNPIHSAVKVGYLYQVPSRIRDSAGSLLGLHSLEVRGGVPLFFLEKYFAILSLNYKFTEIVTDGDVYPELDKSLHAIGLVTNFGFRLKKGLNLMVFGGAAMSGDYERINGYTFIPRAGTMFRWKYSDEWSFLFGLSMSTAYLYYIPIPLFGFSYSKAGSPYKAALGPPGGVNFMLRFREDNLFRIGVNFSGGNWQIKAGEDAPDNLERIRYMEIQAGITVFQKIAGPIWFGLNLGVSPYSVIRSTDNSRTIFDTYERLPSPYIGLDILFVP